jgi:hypothetical protein
MKKSLIYIFISLALASCDPLKAPQTERSVAAEVLTEAKAKIDFNTAKAEIQKVMDDQAQAWNEGNIDEFMKGYWHSDSLKFITQNGIRMGYDSVSLNYKKHYDSKDKMGRLNFSKLLFSSLDKDDEIINVTGKWEVIQKNKTVSGIFSLVFRQVDSKWKIIIDHTW